MKADPSTNTATSKFLNNILHTINSILEQLKIPTWAASLLILFQLSQMTLIMLEFDALDLPDSILNVCYYFNLFAPYKFLQSFSFTIALVVTGISLLLIVVLVYGFAEIYSRQCQSTALIKFYGVFLYLFEYFIFIPMFGALLSIYSLPNSLSENEQQAFILVFGFLLAILSILYFSVVLFFFNFMLRSKDAFARSPDLNHFYFRVLFVLLTILDVVVDTTNYNLKLIVNFGVAIILCLDFIRRMPYYHYTVTLFYFFGVLAFFWFNFLMLFISVIRVHLIKDNIVMIVAVSMLLLLWNIYGFQKYLFDNLISKDFSTISSNDLLEKKIRYLLFLIKASKKSNRDELKLALVVQLHVESCKKQPLYL
jgi:hypothetical protein